MVIYLEAAKAAFNRSVQYRFGMFLSVIFSLVTVGINYAVWSSIYGPGESFGGYTFENIIVHAMLTGVLFSLMWDNTDRYIGEMVYEGTLFQYVLRPVNYVWFALSNKIGNRMFAVIIEVIPTFSLYFLLFPNTWLVPARPLAFAVAVLLAFLFFFLINFMVGCAAFWLKKHDGILWAHSILRTVLIGTLLPLSFYPETLQRVFFFLPFQYMFYVPSTAFIGNYGLTSWDVSLWQSLGIGVVWLFLLYGMVVWLWRKGIQRFEGVGV